MAEQRDPEPGERPAELISRAVRLWRKAQIVHEAPSWEGRPEARAVAEVVARHPDCEPLLYDLLSDRSQLVVAYSLMALELMGSSRLSALPAELLANRSSLTVSLGSVRMSMDLGHFAKQVQKRASAPSA